MPQKPNETLIRTRVAPFEVEKYVALNDVISHLTKSQVSLYKQLKEAKKPEDIKYLEGGIFVIESILTNLSTLN